MISVDQIRMARAALGWSLGLLSEKSGVSARTIRRIESEGGVEKATKANLKIIRETLEAAGICLPYEGLKMSIITLIQNQMWLNSLLHMGSALQKIVRSMTRISTLHSSQCAFS